MAVTKRTYGMTRTNDGKPEIMTEKGWTPYPKRAAELIEFAEDHGWVVASDGLPVRINSDSDLIIAIMLIRPADETMPGFTLRAPWVCEHTSFHIGKVMYRAPRRGWRELPMLRDVHSFIRENKVNDAPVMAER